MSKAIDLPDPPAFCDPGRHRPVFVPVGREHPQVAQLLDHYGTGTAVFRLQDSDYGPSTNRFRIELVDGTKCFIRLLSLAREQQARDVADLISGLPLGTPVVRAGQPIRLSADAIAIESEWVPHRPPQSTFEDMRAIGAASARLHAALRTSGRAHEISARAADRRDVLIARAGKALTLRAQQLIDSIDGRLDALDDLPAQPLHGDLNPGNVLMTEYGVVICDFESANFSWGPPILDLAMVIERLCLPSPEPEEMSWALLHSWQDAAGQLAVPRPEALSDALKIRNLTAVLILTMLSDRGTPASEQEWTKFERLIAGLRLTEAIVERVEARLG